MIYISDLLEESQMIEILEQYDVGIEIIHFSISDVLDNAQTELKKYEKRLGRFLKEKLNLIMSEEKTLITNAGSQAAKFLGYEIKAQRVNDYIDPKGRRGANGAIALLVPAKVIEEKCKKYMKRGKATHRNNLLQDDDFSIVQTYQQEYRGLVQYYNNHNKYKWKNSSVSASCSRTS